MVGIELEDLITSLFKEDLEGSGQASYISQLAIITIKSLIPAKNSMGNRIDYKRFEEEIRLWRQYRRDKDRELLNPEDYKEPEAYFKKGDRTLTFRIIPLIVGNSDFDIGEEEVIKNILFSSARLEDLFEGLLLTRFIYGLIEKKEDLIMDLKNYLIGFGQKDFLDKYRNDFSIDSNSYPSYRIEFERKRIEALNILNGLEGRGFEILRDLMSFLEEGDRESLLGRILGGRSKNEKDGPQLNGFYQGMATYIIRLRKSRIEPERLIIKEYELPDVFSFEEGAVFYHSLLNHSKVIKKEVSKNLLTSTIQTKTGMYRFKRDLN